MDDKRDLFPKWQWKLPNIVHESLGRIVCPKGNNNSFVASATFIAPRLILTARHVLNGFSCRDIKVIFTDCKSNKKVASELFLLEDGAKFGQDYALLYVSQFFGTPIRYTSELPNEGSTFFCAKNFEYLSSIVPNRPIQQILTFESHLKTVPGFSGAPYFDENLKMFGFHLSGYIAHSMWSGMVTGISFSQLLQNIPSSSFLYKALHGIEFNPIPREYFFDDDFRASLPSLGQIDEGPRESALGCTPQLTSLTGTQVLLRYFLKGKAQFIGKSELKDILSAWKNAWLKFTETYFDYRSIAEVGGDYRTLYRILAQVNKWRILIKMPQNGNLDNAKHEWRSLDMKKSSNSGIAGVQMGHKMGAVDYWVYGAGTRNTQGSWLCEERVPQIRQKVKKYNAAKELDTKIQALEQRYFKYKSPGYKDYGNQNCSKFMKEPWNYHFQWWQINQRDGRLAGQKTKYKSVTPAGYKWSGTKLLKK